MPRLECLKPVVEGRCHEKWQSGLTVSVDAHLVRRPGIVRLSRLRWTTFATARLTRPANRSRERSERLAKVGGGGGIRTHGTVPRTAVFKTAAFNHSATPPLINRGSA